MTKPTFRVAISGDFRKADGTPTYPSFDLGPLLAHPDIEVEYLQPRDVIAAEQLEEFDALILLAARFEQSSIPASGRLALVARFGVGFDSVDVAACSAAGIAVAITPDGVRRPVAVSVITLMLALTGKLLIKDRITRLGPAGFNTRSAHMGSGLVGRTLGSLGIGNIGAEVFRMAAPFGMSFIAHDPYADPRLAEELGIRLVGLEELFREADVLSISCPLTADTRHIVNAERLALMKPSAYLINTARGPIIDQRALTQALAENRIAGAGLDVLEQEPPEADDPILALPNVILSPHALCWTDQCFAGIGASDVAAVLAVMRGETPASLANPAVAQMPDWHRRRAGFAASFGA